MEKRPVVLVVMDGIGIREDKTNNAVALANKPTLDKLWKECPHTQLRAHGLAVGLTSAYPNQCKPGFNAGMIVRYLLEKCRNVSEAVSCLYQLPIASAQT